MKNLLKDKTMNITMRRAIKNNWYSLKLVNSISKKRVVWEAISGSLGYLEWIFFSGFFMRYVVGAMEKEKSFAEILVFLGITIAVFAIIAICKNYMEGNVIPITDVKIYKQLYQKLFEKSRNVELACFEDAEFYNKYTLAMDGAGTKICETVHNIWGVILGFIAVVVVFTFMYQVDKLSVLFVIFPILGNFVFGNQLHKMKYKRDKEFAPYNRVIDYVNRVMYLPEYAKEMRLTNLFALMKRKYDEALHGKVTVAKKYYNKGTFLHFFMAMFTYTLIFEGVLFYGAYRTMVSKTVQLADLAVLSTIMVAATYILIGFADSVVAIFKNGLFVENLRGFMEYAPLIPEDYDGENPGTTIECIEFRDVSFAYKEKMTIRHLSFQIRGGCSYALVGHNGAGKTTIIKLLMRLYDPTEGEILLNGKNIKVYNLRQYRELFATAFQDFRMFAMPIMDNVLMRRGYKKDEETVIHALQKAGVYDKVTSLKDGIHTMMTKEFDQDGVVLSGGESQKIGVARAFIKDVPIKIFDEPSSALDPIAEYELFENILHDSKDKTMLFISHRLSSVQSADWIFMLEQGGIIEEGTHIQLMKQNGQYADMYRKQAKNYLATDNLLKGDGVFQEVCRSEEVLV